LFFDKINKYFKVPKLKEFLHTFSSLRKGIDQKIFLQSQRNENVNKYIEMETFFD
jgi:hypothetical protein